MLLAPIVWLPYINLKIKTCPEKKKENKNQEKQHHQVPRRRKRPPKGQNGMPKTEQNRKKKADVIYLIHALIAQLWKRVNLKNPRSLTWQMN
jgi:hypothetical protein